MSNGKRDSEDPHDAPGDADDVTGAPGPRAETDPRTEADAGLTGGESTPADEYEDEPGAPYGDDQAGG